MAAFLNFFLNSFCANHSLEVGMRIYGNNYFFMTLLAYFHLMLQVLHLKLVIKTLI
jgi:hypothetical protein